MRRLLWPLLLIAALAAACKKGGEPDTKPLAQAPPDVIATVTFAHASTFVGHLGKYVDKVAPGMGARIDGAALTQAFTAMTDAGSLEGIDLDKPVRLILLDPKAHTKNPMLLLATFADAEKLKKGVGTLKVETQDGRSLVGAEAEVAAVKSWAFGSLAGQPPPDAPTAEVWIDRVVKAYRAEIEGFSAQMKQASLGTTVQAILDGEIKILLAVGDQSERLFLTFEATDDDAQMVFALAPKADTTLAKFVAVQKPFDPNGLNGLTVPGNAAMILLGHTELGELSEPMYRLAGPLLADVAGKPFDDAFHKMWTDWLKHFDGNFAAVSTMEAGGGTGMTELIGVDDGPAAQKAIQGFLSSLNAPKKVSFAGVDMSFTSAFNVAQHGGAGIDTVAMTFDVSNMEPMQKEMMKRMYPDGMKIAMAGWGKSFGVTLGKNSLEQMNQLIDGITAGGKTKPAVSAFVQSALDASAKRKESMAMVMNMAAMMSPGAQLPPAQSGLVFTMGFAGGHASMRIDIPAAHIAEVMAAFKTAAQPPR